MVKYPTVKTKGELPEWSPEGIPLGEWGDWKEIMSYYAYILKSLSHGTYYYGSSEDVNRRIKEHNEGHVKYTKGRRPWVLHYEEKFETRPEAQKREYFFKSIDGYRYLKSIKIK